ncbi:MAG: transglutaminase-like cysteine peptidase [Pseudomonadota bacterium]
MTVARRSDKPRSGASDDSRAARPATPAANLTPTAVGIAAHPAPGPSRWNGRTRFPAPLPWLWLFGALLLAGCAGQPAPQPQATPAQAHQDLLGRIARDHGPEAAQRVERWFDIIDRGRAAADAERLQLANGFFNRARFTTDTEVWQRDDYWATPIEFLIEDAGDCEEFAIAKYFTLTGMGIAEDALRITYAKALGLDQPHMVLAWYPTPAADPLILDNLDPRILPASQRPDLSPVYSFNGADLWLARNRREQVRSGDAASLSHWRQLRDRLARQLGP